jgi:glycosyltransferase involved in cell wall biosynthesis
LRTFGLAHSTSSGIAEVNELIEGTLSWRTRKFSGDLATLINQLMKDRDLRERFDKAGRKRAEEMFSWNKIAEKTKALYHALSSATSSETYQE